MDLMHRLDAPLPLSGLLALEFDGLLDRLTETVWVPRGTVADPQLRAAALGPAPRETFAASHRTAAWIWWGTRTGRAPAPGEYTTISRVRVRATRASHTVYERDVPPAERERMGRGAEPGWVTGPERTVFDLLRLCLDAAAPVRAAAGMLSRVPAGDRHAFMQWLAGTHRRPYAAAVRTLALAAFTR